VPVKELLSMLGKFICGGRSMTNSKISRQVGVRLANETHDALTRLAKEQRRPLGWVIRDFIEAGLQREERAKKRKTP
jgi:hypothetical protein